MPDVLYVFFVYNSYMKQYCRHCGTEIPHNLNKCPKCHKIGHGGKKHCPQCGVFLEFADATICSHCGHNLIRNKKRQEFKPRSRTIAALLQVLLAWFGAGRFYLGYYGIALLQILVSILTLGIGGLWPLIDGFLILKGKVKTDYDGNELVE